MSESIADTFLSVSFVFIYVFVIVLTEQLIGVLLILGRKTRWELLTIAILLITLTFRQVLQQNIGILANILVYVFAVSFLLFNTRYDQFGIDRGFSVKKAGYFSGVVDV